MSDRIPVTHAPVKWDAVGAIHQFVGSVCPRKEDAVSDVKRYDAEVGYHEWQARVDMEDDPTGHWVEYDDYAALETELAEANGKVARLTVDAERYRVFRDEPGEFSEDELTGWNHVSESGCEKWGRTLDDLLDEFRTPEESG